MEKGISIYDVWTIVYRGSTDLSRIYLNKTEAELDAIELNSTIFPSNSLKYEVKTLDDALYMIRNEIRYELRNEEEW
jgi:hypothetical protein